MEIGNKILELRKKNNLSQESLAEKVGVARQTISKWELGETSPDLKQAIELSKIFNVSLDELVNNDIKDILIEKTSNTEKLAVLIIKILKIIGIVILVFLIINVIAFILFVAVRKSATTSISQTVEMTCTLNEQDYVIEVGSDGYFNCSNCSKELQKELRNDYVDFGNISKTSEDIENYFIEHKGICK